MKVMIDTNIIISAALFPTDAPHRRLKRLYARLISRLFAIIS